MGAGGCSCRVRGSFYCVFSIRRGVECISRECSPRLGREAVAAPAAVLRALYLACVHSVHNSRHRGAAFGAVTGLRRCVRHPPSHPRPSPVRGRGLRAPLSGPPRSPPVPPARSAHGGSNRLVLRFTRLTFRVNRVSGFRSFWIQFKAQATARTAGQRSWVPRRELYLELYVCTSCYTVYVP